MLGWFEEEKEGPCGQNQGEAIGDQAGGTVGSRWSRADILYLGYSFDSGGFKTRLPH